MQTHEIKRNTPNRDRRYVGRGGKRGKTAGRGTKGQNARAGRKIKPVIRDFIKKIPKNRGYKFKSIKAPVTVDKAKLKTLFKTDEKVTMAEIRKRLKLSGAKIILK